MNETEKAERIQAWKAFLIPSSLFVACLLNAAGIYIIYTGNSIGVIFLGCGIATIVAGMFAFVTFHNKRRAKGDWKRVAEVQDESGATYQLNDDAQEITVPIETTEPHQKLSIR